MYVCMYIYIYILYVLCVYNIYIYIYIIFIYILNIYIYIKYIYMYIYILYVLLMIIHGYHNWLWVTPPVSDHLKKGIDLSAAKALKWQHHRQKFGMRAALMETATPKKTTNNLNIRLFKYSCYCYYYYQCNIFELYYSVILLNNIIL